MSDDDPGRTERHLVNRARKHQPPPQNQNQPPVKKLKSFNPRVVNMYWLSQAWSPDGTQLAFGGRNASDHGILHLWNAHSGHHETLSMRHLTHGLVGPVVALAWSPDSRYLATVEHDHASDQRVVHVRGQSEAPRPIPVPAGAQVTQVAWSPDGARLALGGPDCGQTALVDVTAGTVTKVLDNLSGPVAWQPDGQLIAGCYETSVLLCDPRTGARVKRLTEPTHRPSALGWSKDGKTLAVADGEEIVIWDVDKDTWRWRLHWVTSAGDRGPDGTIGDLQWLDKGGYLLEFRPHGGAARDEQGSAVGTVIVWDIETGKWRFIELFWEFIGGARKPPAGITLAPDGKRFALANDRFAPVIWEITADLPNFRP